MTSTTTSPQRAHQATNALPDSSYGVSEDHPSRRSVLQATDCPESLGGSLRFLAVLREILRTHKPSWLDDHQGWQQEIGSIEDQIHARNIRHGDDPCATSSGAAMNVPRCLGNSCLLTLQTSARSARVRRSTRSRPRSQKASSMTTLRLLARMSPVVGRQRAIQKHHHRATARMQSP